MNKRKLKGYFLKTFLFNIRKERAIYAYLCKEKLDREQKKLFTDETRFMSYQSWKAYIVDRYQTYPKESLIEFSKAINLFLRESKKLEEYKKSIDIAYFSAMISTVIAHITAEENTALILVIAFLATIFVFWMVVKVYEHFREEDIYFYEDIKSIIDQMIEEKG